MATVKAFTDLQQSRKLAEILPLESADMFYADLLVGGNHKYNLHPLESYGFKTFEDTKLKTSDHLDFIPCWSLAALISVLPYKLQNILAINGFQEDRKEKYVIGSVENNRYDCYADNPVDACYEMIIHLHELNLL